MLSRSPSLHVPDSNKTLLGPQLYTFIHLKRFGEIMEVRSFGKDGSFGVLWARMDWDFRKQRRWNQSATFNEYSFLLISNEISMDDFLLFSFVSFKTITFACIKNVNMSPFYQLSFADSVKRCIKQSNVCKHWHAAFFWKLFSQRMGIVWFCIL